MEHSSYTNYYIRVKKFNGTSWELIDGGSGRNRTTSYNMVVGSSIIAFDNAIYLAWTEGNAIYVDKYQGGVWTAVDGGDINRTSGNTVNYPELSVYNGKLYISWQERNSSFIEQARVKRYDGGTTWTLVDGNGENGLNYNTGYRAQVPCIKAFGPNLYLAFFEYDGTKMDLRVKKYDGTTWSAADSGNVNINTFNNSTRVDLEEYNGSLYMTWIKNGSDVYTKLYDGTNWVLVDDASYPTLNMDVYFSKLYSDGTNLYHILKTSSGVRVRKYDGLGWSDIDGGTVLNKDPAKGTDHPAMAVDSSKAFAFWAETNSSNIYQVRAAWYLPLTITPSEALTELNLDSASLALSFEGTTFKDNILNAANFSLIGAPEGLTIESVTYDSETGCTVNLAFDGTDFPSDISNFGIQIAADEVNAGYPLSSNNLTITAYSTPTVTINSVAVEGSATSFDITAEVTADGGAGVTERGIEWKLSTAGEYTRETDAGTGTGSFTKTLNGLALFSTYNVRAYAVNAVGTAYSGVVNFTPGVNTLDITPPIQDVALLSTSEINVNDSLVYIGNYQGDEKYALKFDLSGIQEDWTIASATLKLYVPEGEIYGSPEINVVGSTDDTWNESDNPVLPDTSGGTTIVTGRSVSEYGWLTVTGEDLTNFVISQMADGYASFLVTGSTSEYTDFGINTKENPGFKPVLSIEYTVAAPEDTVIATPAIAGVTPPVKGATPVDSIDETSEYTAAISWTPADATFAPSTVYTATITITPKAGYTLTGVPENFFTVAGASATNAADSGVVTAVFPATAAEEEDSIISTSAIAGVTPPVKGATSSPMSRPPNGTVVISIPRSNTRSFPAMATGPLALRTP